MPNTPLPNKLTSGQKQSMKNAGFDPANFGFTRLPLRTPHFVAYERTLPNINYSKIDYLRVNIFLTQDGPFIRIWYGVFDIVFTEPLLKIKFDDFPDLFACYNEIIFKGYIRTPEDADIILQSLRFDKYIPSQLSLDENDRIRNDSLK